MNQRLEFANFLGRVASHLCGSIEWQAFVVCHYSDELLEDVRRKLAKMSIDREGGSEWSDFELAALQEWSRELRSQSDSPASGPPKDWRRTVGMFKDDLIMKAITDEALRMRETERAAVRKPDERK